MNKKKPEARSQKAEGAAPRPFLNIWGRVHEAIDKRIRELEAEIMIQKFTLRLLELRLTVYKAARESRIVIGRTPYSSEMIREAERIANGGE